MAHNFLPGTAIYNFFQNETYLGLDENARNPRKRQGVSKFQRFMRENLKELEFKQIKQKWEQYRCDRAILIHSDHSETDDEEGFMVDDEMVMEEEDSELEPERPFPKKRRSTRLRIANKRKITIHLIGSSEEETTDSSDIEDLMTQKWKRRFLARFDGEFDWQKNKEWKRRIEGKYVRQKNNERKSRWLKSVKRLVCEHTLGSSLLVPPLEL